MKLKFRSTPNGKMNFIPTTYLLRICHHQSIRTLHLRNYVPPLLLLPKIHHQPSPSLPSHTRGPAGAGSGLTGCPLSDRREPLFMEGKGFPSWRACIQPFGFDFFNSDEFGCLVVVNTGNQWPLRTWKQRVCRESAPPWSCRTSWTAVPGSRPYPGPGDGRRHPTKKANAVVA